MDGTNDVVGGDMGNALSSILSNPTLMAKISAIAGSLSDSGQGAVSTAPPPGNAAPSGLASALSNPALLSKLPEVMATIAPILSGSNGGNGNSEQKNHTANVDASFPVASVKTDAPCRAHRTALLCALRPYVSPRRREAIDYIIKIDRLGDLLHNLT